MAFRYEWLFVCDTMDAIFKNSDDIPAGVIDKISLSGILNSADSSSAPDQVCEMLLKYTEY